jgi:succinate-semialdehyde dehydrogenase / glutarate-semialdehyde dehydrogenase
MIRSINPATEALLAEFAPWTPSEVDAAVEAAANAQRYWRERPVQERADAMRSLAALLRDRSERYAQLITQEMGKPIAEARAEIEKCAVGAEHYAQHGPGYLAPERVETESLDSYVAYEPLGVVLAVMPWNFPFWQVVRAGVPILMAGNAVVLKHASNVPQCALAVEEAFRDAGLPDGLLRALLVEGAAVEAVIADARIAGVTLTGSSQVGARIASLAGSHLKKQVLELGGSDPFIVLADADVPYAARVAARARNQNNGQSCIAAKRFLVADEIGDEFVARLADAIRELRVGDPLDSDVQVGPLARADLRETLADQVAATVRAGAEVVVGDGPIPDRGWYVAPTLLDGVRPEMAAFREETFGPVAAVTRVHDLDEAITLANDTVYGLGASVWTRDLDASRHIARRLEAGSVFVNGLVASDARMPLGGVKASGYGRELGEHGAREFTNVQTVRIGPGDGPG